MVELKKIGSHFDGEHHYTVYQDPITLKKYLGREPDFCKPKPLQLRFNLEDAFDARGRRRAKTRRPHYSEGQKIN